MDTRGQESPMDFQWDNPAGRIDPNSPFRVNSARAAAAQETPTKKNTFHLFQSPTKSTPFQSTIHKSTPFQTPFQTPATNNLFAGFHTPGTSKPPGSIYRQPSFTQPRFNTDLKGALPDLASPIDGGMDTESEAPTPDQLAYEARRRGYTTTPSRTTGRGEIPRGRNTESRVDKVKRLNSRNRRSKDLDRHYDSDDRGSDDDDSNQPRRRVQQRVETQVYEQGWVKNHEHIPQILLSYTGVFIRIFLGLLLLWCLFTITMTVRQDIHQKIDEYSSHAARVVSQCAFDHLQNRCSPDMMAPALRVQCDEWERCMNRDPKKITWTKVGAETAAEVANSFFNNISAKTMIFTFLIILGCLFYIISGPGPKSIPHPYQQPMHPPSFQHHQQNWNPTPHHSPVKMMWQTPMPMPETPTRPGRNKKLEGDKLGKPAAIEWE